MNNRRFQVDVYALKSLLHYVKGDLEDAFTYLNKALKLARPGGIIRVFRDHGEKMKEVILASPNSASTDAFIGEILSTFNDTQKEVPITALSEREQQILLYLSDRLTNKEIGARLFIAEKTVKNHLNSIYRKLGASGRRDALLKAREGMLI